jgi:hypothetical protein
MSILFYQTTRCHIPYDANLREDLAASFRLWTSIRQVPPKRRYFSGGITRRPFPRDSNPHVDQCCMSARRVFPCLEIGLVWSGCGVLGARSDERKSDSIKSSQPRDTDGSLCMPLGTTVCLIDRYSSEHVLQGNLADSMSVRSVCLFRESEPALELPLKRHP